MSLGFQFCTGLSSYRAEGYAGSLFHTAKHLALGTAEVQSFFIIHPNRQVCCGEVHFHIDGATAISRMHAPFGSFLFNNRLAPEVISDFIDYCEHELKKNGVEKLVLVHAPNQYYAEQYALLHPLLFKKEFYLLDAEVSSLLHVERGNFSEALHEWEQRKLRQARVAGLQAICVPGEELQGLYDFLKGCRRQKGYELSMSYGEVEQLYLHFPEAIHLFAVYDKSRIAAAALCVVVNPEVLYAFYYDHHRDYDRVSPVVLLMEFIYRWCAEKKFRYLDLGTSTTAEGMVNFPLLAFKLHLGAVPSPKYIFQKVLK